MSDRVMKLRTELLRRVKEVYQIAIISRQEHRVLIQRLQAVYNDPIYRNLPRYAVNYVRGYEQAIMDELYRCHLVYGRYIAGRFVSTDSSRHDYYGKQGISPSEWAFATQKELCETGHYWVEADKDGKMCPFATESTRT